MTDEDFRADMERQGYVAVRKLPTGDWIGIPTSLTVPRICVGLDDTGYRLFYDYETGGAALAAALTWNGLGDPSDDWVRKMGRVRPGGRYITIDRREFP